MNADFLDTYAYVTISTYRNKVLAVLYRDNAYKTPTQIARETSINTSHISKVLSDLKGKSLIECINENRKKGRLYHLTDMGKNICSYLIEQQGDVYVD